MQKYFMKQLLTKTNNCHAVRLVEKKKTIITNLLQCLQPNSRRLRTPATNFSYWTASCINFSQKAVDSEDKFLHTCLWWFLKIYISQGSVTTQLRCGGVFNNHFTTNFLQNMRVKKFWKLVNIWQRYGQKFVAYFFGGHPVYRKGPIRLIYSTSRVTPAIQHEQLLCLDIFRFASP